MKKYMVGLFLMLAGSIAYAGISADNKHILNEQAGSAAHKARLGTLVDQTKGALSVVWNASTGSLGSSTLRTGAPLPVTFGDHKLGVDIPAKSLITRAWVEVTDPPVHFGPGAAPGISFHCSTGAASGDIALSSSTTYAAEDGGTLLDLTAQNTLATMQRNHSTTDCSVRARVHGQNASSGKITLFVEYMQIR